jgi:AcrR family transcriptional regulator
VERRSHDLERRAEIGRERRARTRAKIVAAAFDLFGEENGLYSRIEDIAAEAGVTRPTFYNHFTGMEELREALTREVTHDFLVAVTMTIDGLPDPRARAATAIRLYLHRARNDRRWAWSMVNMSANGVIFGAETHRQAEQTVREGIEAGVLTIPSSALGRDLILGSALAAIATMLRESVADDYAEAVAEHILLGLGVPWIEARKFARSPMPSLQT